MSKRVQIPVSASEERLLKTAAKRRGLSLAEWARRLLKEKAQEDLGPERKTPEQALKSLFAVNAPVDTVDVMIKESFAGRYK